MTPGEYTTEYKIAQSANLWSSVGLILGVLTMMLGILMPILTPILGVNSKWVIIGGAALSFVSQIYDALVKSGYIKARTELKIAEAKKEQGL